MEESEVPIEHLHEEMQHQAKHSKSSWTMGVALSSALLAGLAAVTSLLAGHHANEAMVEQIKAANDWSYFQSKSIKENLLITKKEILEGLGKGPNPNDLTKLAQYKDDKDKIQTSATAKEEGAKHHLETHVIFARGVTLFQVAIAVGAISVLTNRKRFWFVSLIFGAAGVFFLTQGLIHDSGAETHHGPSIESSPQKPTAGGGH